MKRNILTYIIYTFLIVGAIIAYFIIFRNIDNAFSFVFGYVVFLLLSLLYFIFVTVINMRKLKWFDLRKRLLRFFILFIILGVTTYILKYVSGDPDIDVYDFAIPLGLSFGFSFFDLVFYEEKKEQ